MRQYSLLHINAFTTSLFGGNPAGVVLDAAGLKVNEMQSIAREMNLSETAFILPPSTKRADLRIRWFTPKVEVALCGHATIASFHALAETGLPAAAGLFGMQRNGTYFFRVQTKSGILRTVVEKSSSSTTIELQLPVPRFSHVKKLSPRFLSALGVTPTHLHQQLPIVKDSCLYVPLKKLSILKSLEPDFIELAKCSDEMGVLGVALFSTETIDKGSTFHSRFFGPSVGINEDPVTGSTNGPIGAYLLLYAQTNGVALRSTGDPDGRIEYIGEQGDIIGRKGRVKIRIKIKKWKIETLAIAGEAKTFYSSIIQL